MSRFSKPDIWMHVFGEVSSAPCPCCNTRHLHRDIESSWIDGHIVPDKDKRWVTNVLINHRPLCIECNKADNPFRYPSNFHYSADLGVITRQEAERLYTLHTAELEYLQKHPNALICEKPGCQKNKKPRSRFCGTHKNYENQVKKQEEKIAKQIKKEEEQIAKDLGKLIVDAEKLLKKMQGAGIQKYYSSLKSVGFLFSDHHIGQLNLPPLPASPPLSDSEEDE